MYSDYKSKVEMSKGASGNTPAGNADLQELWTRLSGASSDTCKSLLKKNLTQARFDALKDKKTKFGGTLADCIRSGEGFLFKLCNLRKNEQLICYDTKTLNMIVKCGFDYFSQIYLDQYIDI